MSNKKETLIDRYSGDYVSFTDWLKGIHVAGIIRSRKRLFHQQECYIQVIHCINIDSYDFINDVDEYLLGVEDEFVCKIKDMRFYRGEQNYRDLNVCWCKADEKRNKGKCTGDIRQS